VFVTLCGCGLRVRNPYEVALLSAEKGRAREATELYMSTNIRAEQPLASLLIGLMKLSASSHRDGWIMACGGRDQL
jgi:hypothetical protein